MGFVTLAFALAQCSDMRKLHKNNPDVDLKLPKNVTPVVEEPKQTQETAKIISFKKQDGTEVFFTPIEVDTLTGEKLMSVQIDEVIISAASRRNLVERNGKINVDFVVTVPKDYYNKNWRFVIDPVIKKGDDTLLLAPLIFTGEQFRNQQEDAYSRYDDFERSIIDSAQFFQYFGDRKGFYKFIEQHDRQQELYKGYIARLEQLTPQEAEADEEVGWISKGKQKSRQKQLRKYIVNTDRKVMRYMSYLPDESDPLDHLTDYFTPRYHHANKAQHPGGEIYTRVAGKYQNPKEQQREEYIRKVNKSQADIVFHLDRATKQELIDDATARVQHTGYRSKNINGLVYEMRDSAVLANYAKQDEFFRLMESDQLDTATLIRMNLNKKQVGKNEQKRTNRDLAFANIVRKPYIHPAKLDTVIHHMNGSVSYLYNETVQADENTSKLYLFLNGEVETYSGKETYELIKSDTLTYNVASMTSFLDETVRYKQRIILRDAEANARFFFTFPQGKSKLNDTMRVNRTQLNEVRNLTRNLMTDPIYIIDSITLRATSSPEGTWAINDRLAKERAESLRRVLVSEFRILYDSLRIEASYTLNDRGETVLVESNENDLPNLPEILRTAHLAEDWAELRRLILKDENLEKKQEILEIFDQYSNPDVREFRLRAVMPKEYAYIRENLYPQMRAVDFRFNLHRRGMQQDTVYTTEVDDEYMHAIDLLKKRRYEEALTILRPYEDRNTALAYMSLGYDAAAYRILQQVPDSDNIADVQYMLAILASRLGDEEQAVQYFMHSTELRQNLKFRGNLDPEISRLIRKYGIFKEDFM